MSEPATETFDEWASWFKVLADGTRLRVLHHLSGLDGPVTVGDLAEALGLTQPNVSHHLKVLGEQRFVVTEREGVRTLVRVNPNCMSALPEAAASIMRAAG